MRALTGIEPIKLVALKGWELSGDDARTMDALFDGHFKKPLTDEALDELLD